jgi:predicted MFS family arabinose efflux permease
VNAKLLMGIGMAVGSALGTALYQLVRYGVSEIDWARALFIAMATFTVLLLVPRKWIERPRSQPTP